MSKSYAIATDDGAVFVRKRLNTGVENPVEVGDEVELTLDHADQERALLAAGWLEEVKSKKKEG